MRKKGFDNREDNSRSRQTIINEFMIKCLEASMVQLGAVRLSSRPSSSQVTELRGMWATVRWRKTRPWLFPDDINTDKTIRVG